MSDSGLSLCYAVADQHFGRTKSIGIFNFSLGLLKALADSGQRLCVLGNPTLAGQLSGLSGAQIRSTRLPLRGAVGRIVWDQWSLARFANRSRCDWLFLPKGFAPVFAPIRPKLAACVHDTMFLHYRDRYPRQTPKLENFYFDHCLRATLRRAALVVTTSEFTRTELTRYAGACGIQPPRIVPVGVGFAAPEQPVPDKDGSIAVLASTLPHKRTELATRYLAQWQAHCSFSGVLRWIGRLPEGLPRPESARWEYHARLEPAQYQRYLGQARVVVYTSDYEGFGMPPVEAVLHGACPVYSDLPATREVMRGMGQAFDNDRYEDFQRAMDAALETPATMIEEWRGMLLALYNWPAVGRRVVEAIAAADGDSHRKTVR